MDKFTIKDFIEKNNFCFLCQTSMALKIKIQNPSRYLNGYHTVSPKIIENNLNNLYEFELDVSYNKSLILQINPVTNKFTPSSNNSFLMFLQQNVIFFTLSCKQCDSFILSEVLKFDLLKNFLMPISIHQEFYSINNDNTVYKIASFYRNKVSLIDIKTIENNKQKELNTITVPLLKKNNFKDRNSFLSKIKTIITFS